MLQGKIAVIGDAGLDVYLHGRADRLCPEAPVPVFIETSQTKVMGLGANVASNIERLGGQAELMTVLGKNPESILSNLNIHRTTTIEDDSRLCTIKTRYLVGNHFLLRRDEETVDPLSERTEDSFIEAILDRFKAGGFQAVVLSDYAKGVLTPRVCQEVIGAAKGKMPVVVDPKPKADVRKYQGATVMTPNLKETSELQTFLGISHEGPYFEICKSLNLESLIVTRGEQGILVCQDGKQTEIKAIPRKVYDVCGAGDTVVATLALGLASGLSLVESAKLANAAASVVVGKLGTATVSLDELQAELDHPIS